MLISYHPVLRMPKSGAPDKVNPILRFWKLRALRRAVVKNVKKLFYLSSHETDKDYLYKRTE